AERFELALEPQVQLPDPDQLDELLHHRREQHQFISMSSQGEELRLLLAPVVQEFVELIRVWELNLRLEGELESLCDDRENDVRSLT
ncbi:MAG: hypothetical protein KA391_02980, partial [Luteimonas sp.]|nr:hypothetical protein [Luteimonas sp.]